MILAEDRGLVAMRPAERARRPIVSAIDRDGTFLDVGCANGLLMESLATWAGEEPVEETLRSWGYTVAGEAEGVDTNGAVFTRIAWTDTPEACYSIVSDTTLSPASLSGTQ